MNQEIATKLSTARARLLLDHPFFGVLALRLQLVEDTSQKTLAVNGQQIFYNPDFVASLSLPLCSSAIAHEVMHCVLDHISRRQARDPVRWNIAADYVANPILKEAGLPLGDGWLYNPAYLDKSAEEVYAMLPEGTGGAGGAGGGHDKALCEVQNAAGNEPGTANAADVEATALEWKLATVQAAKANKGHGNLPGQLKKILDDILTPSIPWRDALASFMTERVKDDYSWRRPNPYYAHTGIYLPSMDGVGMGTMVIALDTSGSVVSVLDEFGSTVKDIVASVRPERVHVIYCDADVNRVDVFERGQELSFEAVGGGGTDFRPVFDYIKNNSINPACTLYLTDMYGTFPQEKPEYPVLWCATSDVRGPFGDTLRIKE